VIGTDDAPVFQSAFADRADAGRQLASRLENYRGADLLVLGLPRGGVVVAVEVARTLGAELDVVVVRKIGAPRQPELALGAVVTDGSLCIKPRGFRAGAKSRQRHPDAFLSPAVVDGCHPQPGRPQISVVFAFDFHAPRPKSRTRALYGLWCEWVRHVPGKARST
jgi:hypothetical protein